MKRVYSFALVLLLMSCNSTDSSNAEHHEHDSTADDTMSVIDTSNTLSPIPEGWKQKAAAGIDFIATGNEPFWSIEIDEEQFIRYTTPEGVELTTAPVKSINVDAVTKLYKAETDTGKLEMRVMKKVCINDMSGDSLAYTVHLKIKLKKDEKPRELHGCGTSLKP